MNRGYEKPKSEFELRREALEKKKILETYPDFIKARVALWEEVISGSGVGEETVNQVVEAIRNQLYNFKPRDLAAGHTTDFKLAIKNTIWVTLASITPEIARVQVHETYSLETPEPSLEARTNFNLYNELTADIDSLE